VDTGLIAQNVYLAASALGLACWFHNCDKQALAKLLHHFVVFESQRVYPLQWPAFFCLE
jgi:hypothetical protein